MAQCFDGEVTPLVAPFEQRNQACLDIGCGIIAVTQVIPANGGAEFYEDCSGAIVTGTVVTCPPKVLVMNPAGAGGTDVSTLAKEATLGLIKTSADTLVTASGTTNSTLDDILLGQATAANQTTTIAAINAAKRGYAYDAALGNIAGVTPLTISGYGATNASGVVVADLGSGVNSYPFPTVATTMTISSTSASDTALGSGAQTVSITYIDFTTRAEVTAIVALNGLTPVGFTLNGFRVNDASCLTFGANGENMGEIYIGSGVVDVLGVPAVRYGKIRRYGLKLAQAVYTVPAGKTLDLVSIAGFGVVSTITPFQLRSRLTAQDKATAVLNFSQIGTFNLAGSISPLSFPAGTDIYFLTHAGAASNVGITCQCYLR